MKNPKLKNRFQVHWRGKMESGIPAFIVDKAIDIFFGKPLEGKTAG